MARKWQNEDSARLMTTKYNETAEEVEDLKKGSKEINQATQTELDELYSQLSKKVETRADLDLDKVDNTPDSEKPLSIPQSIALEQALSSVITAEDAEVIEGEEIKVVQYLNSDAYATKNVGETYTSLSDIPVNSQGYLTLNTDISPDETQLSYSYVCIGSDESRTLQVYETDSVFTNTFNGESWTGWKSSNSSSSEESLTEADLTELNNTIDELIANHS